MHRYYKISHEWAEKLGESETAPRHPDGMHLVTPAIANIVCNTLLAEEGVNLLPEEAFAHIGAIGLTLAEVQASARGELRHDALPEEVAGDLPPVNEENESDVINEESETDG